MNCTFVWGSTQITPVGCARGRNAWEINYGDGVHMDVVPCVTRGDLDCVCNTTTGKFEPTDGTGYRSGSTEDGCDQRPFKDGDEAVEVYAKP